LTTEEYLQLYQTDLESETEVLGMALAIEAQALDLYSRAAQRSENHEEFRNVLLQIAAEERSHMAKLSDYMDQHHDTYEKTTPSHRRWPCPHGHPCQSRYFIHKGYGVTVIQPSEYHYYSGMGPGMLGGTYKPDDIRFATRKLVEAQGGRFVLGKAASIDPERAARLSRRLGRGTPV
jgi:hypothetical protein